MMANKSLVLIVDDDQQICRDLSVLMKRNGFDVCTAHDGPTALTKILSDSPDILFLDFMLPGMNGGDVMTRAAKLAPDLPVIIITGHADVHGAVEMMKGGANNYLAKPFEHHEVVRVAQQALKERSFKFRDKELGSWQEKSFSLARMMGTSDVISHLVTQVNQVAKSDFTVIIQGETGSGKELVARAIHAASSRATGPFVALDCGAIPETLLENELFGHERGAYTGAVAAKSGKFEEAKGGTLFLDEITNMGLDAQARLLRVLQEKLIHRIGGSKSIAIDVRVLVATNLELEKLTARAFRTDLFYRLNEFCIKIPPLRKRSEDITYLANRFLKSANDELGKKVQGFNEETIVAMRDYKWPGNVRQLRSSVRRSVLLADDFITPRHMDFIALQSEPLQSEVSKWKPLPTEISWNGFSLKDTTRRLVGDAECEIIKKALLYTGGNKAQAARLLGIDNKTIHTKVKQFQVTALRGESNG